MNTLSSAQGGTHAEIRPETLAITVKRGTEILGIGPTKIYELIAAGAIESVKIGGRRLLVYESLKRLVDRSKQAAA